MGEDNPHTADPRYALWPYPPNCAGHRLQDKIMGVSLGEYIAYRRVNLCAGRWRIAEARASADEVLRECVELPLVLLGAKVASAFGVGFLPFRVRLLSSAHRLYTTVVHLPHPSGRCRAWNEVGSHERARAALRQAGVLPP